MKVNWVSTNGKVNVEFECSSVEELTKKLVTLSRIEDVPNLNTDIELFEKLSELENTDVIKDEVCGKCQSNQVVYVVRENSGNKYYEMRCKECYAKLPFGANKKGGGLFAKRRDDEGKFRGGNGWVKYNRETGLEE